MPLQEEELSLALGCFVFVLFLIFCALLFTALSVVS